MNIKLDFWVESGRFGVETCPNSQQFKNLWQNRWSRFVDPCLIFKWFWAYLNRTVTQKIANSEF